MVQTRKSPKEYEANRGGQNPLPAWRPGVREAAHLQRRAAAGGPRQVAPHPEGAAMLMSLPEQRELFCLSASTTGSTQQRLTNGNKHQGTFDA